MHSAPLGCHNDSECCARSRSCDSKAYVISKLAHQPFVSGPQPIWRGGGDLSAIHPRYVSYHASPHHTRGTWKNVGIHFKRSRSLVLRHRKQQATCAPDLGFGIFIIWCGLERFKRLRLFASGGEVMWGVRLNEDWRRESSGGRSRMELNYRIFP